MEFVNYEIVNLCTFVLAVMIEKHEQAVHAVDLEKQFEHSTCTVYTLLKQEESRVFRDPFISVQLISMQNSDLIFELRAQVKVTL